jgi:two-component system phosphate regulon sensor histidine kinase PhoR
MDFFLLILGLGLGLGIGFGLHYRNRRQLGQILEIAANGQVEHSSLSVISRLRREITRSRAAKAALDVELEAWKQALAVAPIGYLHIDAENQLLSCNAVARQLLCIDRWQPDRLRLLLELVRSYELDRLIEQARQSQQVQVQSWVFETTKLMPLDTEASPGSDRPRINHSVPLRATCVPLSNNRVGVFLEDRSVIVELTQARDRAFSDIMHELRTPLTSIRLVAETLYARLEGQEKIWVERLLQETSRLIDLIQNCLEISRLQKNPQQNLEYQEIELKSFILSLWQTLEPLAKEKEITLTYSDPGEVTCSGDVSRLSQVFLNILDNSIKYSPVQGNIHIAIENRDLALPSDANLQESQNSWTIIDIIDCGCGFRAADLPHVFERLYRGEASRTRQPLAGQPTIAGLSRAGNGLGLAIAKQIIEAHGGAISAQNHPTAGGAWLQIKLPNIIYP